MPFKIVRNDITKVKADVIVNTANPNPICASGTDLAIYEAAGKEKLLAERANIGKIARGDIAVTGAYSLNAKYIIHTVGPVWTDGLHHEFEILEHCYRKSLQKALELKCESIAFPLISTGVYGFPKDKALQIAVSVFSQFLTENEMEIILVVFDKRSFQLSGQIVGDIDSYIDANYVREIHRKEYPLRSRRSTHVKELAEEDFNEEMLQREEDNYPLEEMTDTGMTELLMPLENISLEDQLANIGVLKDLFEKLGFQRKDLKTVYFNVDTEYESYQDRDKSWKRRFKGYKYNHHMKIEFAADNKRLGQVLYALAHSSLRPEFSIEYTVADVEKCKNELLHKAIEDSIQKAQVLTTAANVKLGEIQAIDYSWGEIDFVTKPLNEMRLMECTECEMSAPGAYDIDIEADDINVTDTATVIWEIA